MPASDVRTAGAAERIEFVDENDRGRVLTRLLEQIAYPGGTHPDEHFDELGPGNRKERHSSLAGHGTGEQSLAGARRSDQQHTFWWATTKTPIDRGLLQKIDDLDKLFLRLVDPGDIGECDFGFLLD